MYFSITGGDRNHIVVWVTTDKQLLKDVMKIIRKNDMILLVKFIKDKEILNDLMPMHHN